MDDQGDALVDAGGGAKGVGRSVAAIVHEAIDGGGGHMAAGVAGAKVEEDPAFALDPAAGEGDIGDIADAFITLRCEQVAAGFMDHPRRIIKGGHERIERVAESRGRIANAVCELQPAVGRFDGRGAQAVFDFEDRVVLAVVDDFFLFEDGVFDGIGRAEVDVGKCPTLHFTADPGFAQ